MTGRSSRDVDGGRTTVRSRRDQAAVNRDGPQAAVLGRDGRTGDLGRRPFDPARRAVRQHPGDALTVGGNGTKRTPAWTSLDYAIPASLQGRTVFIQLVATDAGSDATSRRAWTT